MSDSKEYFSAEYKVFQEENDRLCVGFVAAYNQLSGLFYGKELITRDVHHSSIYDTETTRKVQRMVNNLENQIKLDPNVYYTIVEVLKNTNGCKLLGDHLEKKVQSEMKKNEGQNQKVVQNIVPIPCKNSDLGDNSFTMQSRGDSSTKVSSTGKADDASPLVNDPKNFSSYK